MICCQHIYASYGAQSRVSQSAVSSSSSSIGMVLHDVCLEAHAGETVAILGPNGSGKTTLLRVLSGVMPPESGTVHLKDSNMTSLSPRQRAQQVAVVPQRVEHLPRLRAWDMVLLGRYPYLSWWGMYSARDHAAAQSALKATGAAPLAQRFLEELSGGELQRVLLARALTQGSPVLLLDELSAGLDVARMKELFDLLELRRRAGACVVTVMHDLNLAALYATRLVGLQAGRVLFDGPVNQVFTEEHLSTLYETPMHVFPHPVCPVPQACPGACGTFAAPQSDTALPSKPGLGGHYDY